MFIAGTCHFSLKWNYIFAFIIPQFLIHSTTLLMRNMPYEGKKLNELCFKKPSLTKIKAITFMEQSIVLVNMETDPSD